MTHVGGAAKKHPAKTQYSTLTTLRGLSPGSRQAKTPAT